MKFFSVLLQKICDTYCKAGGKMGGKQLELGLRILTVKEQWLSLHLTWTVMSVSIHCAVIEKVKAPWIYQKGKEKHHSRITRHNSIMPFFFPLSILISQEKEKIHN